MVVVGDGLPLRLVSPAAAAAAALCIFCFVAVFGFRFGLADVDVDAVFDDDVEVDVGVVKLSSSSFCLETDVTVKERVVRHGSNALDDRLETANDSLLVEPPRAMEVAGRKAQAAVLVQCLPVPSKRKETTMVVVKRIEMEPVLPCLLLLLAVTAVADICAGMTLYLMIQDE